MKIAVCSPDITNLGGVSRCVVVLIEALNKEGIIPDYYGLHSNKQTIKDLFNRGIKYNFKKLLWPRKAYLYSAWMKNMQLIFKEYNYVFDFTNTLPFSSNKGKYLSYVLYPEFLTSRGKYNKGLWRFYYFPHKILASLRKNMLRSPSVKIVCVSKNVSDLIYDIFGKRYSVLYPPANIREFQNKINKKSGVVSVGGFSHEKNQLEQIEISKSFDNIEFTICGNSKRNPSYFSEVVEKGLELEDVRIYPDLSFEKLKQELIRAEVFINSGREDPFCMAVIEGIAAGCIPLIHDSGGVVEIVPFKELRYKNKDDAVKKLKNILKMNKKEKDKLRKKLMNHIKQFGEERFIKKLFDISKINTKHLNT